jgi:hypothetical protein
MYNPYAGSTRKKRLIPPFLQVLSFCFTNFMKMRRVSMNIKRFRVLILCVVLAVFAPNVVTATSVELNIPIQAAIEKLKTSADGATKIKLTLFYDGLLTAQQQNDSWDEKISLLHFNNEEALLQLLQQMKEINKDTLLILEADLEKAKNRYKPLFNVSTPLTTMFGTKVKLVRTAAQLARIDIQTKEIALKKVKDNKTMTIKKIQLTLAEINSIKVQIKSAKSSASMQKTRVTSTGKSFNQAVKKSDTKLAMEFLTTLSALSRQIVDQKQKILTMEQKVNDIIIKAKSQVPA